MLQIILVRKVGTGFAAMAQRSKRGRIRYSSTDKGKEALVVRV